VTCPVITPTAYARYTIRENTSVCNIDDAWSNQVESSISSHVFRLTCQSAKVKTSLARAADVDDDFRVSRHINTSHSRRGVFGIRVGWSIVSTPKNSSTHERERLRMKKIRGAEAAETRRNAADVDGSTPCVAMILLSWSGMRTSSPLVCIPSWI